MLTLYLFIGGDCRRGELRGGLLEGLGEDIKIGSDISGVFELPFVVVLLLG